MAIPTGFTIIKDEEEKEPLIPQGFEIITPEPEPLPQPKITPAEDLIEITPTVAPAATTRAEPSTIQTEDTTTVVDIAKETARELKRKALELKKEFVKRPLEVRKEVAAGAEEALGKLFFGQSVVEESARESLFLSRRKIKEDELGRKLNNKEIAELSSKVYDSPLPQPQTEGLRIAKSVGKFTPKLIMGIHLGNLVQGTKWISYFGRGELANIPFLPRILEENGIEGAAKDMTINMVIDALLLGVSKVKGPVKQAMKDIFSKSGKSVKKPLELLLETAQSGKLKTLPDISTPSTKIKSLDILQKKKDILTKNIKIKNQLFDNVQSEMLQLRQDNMPANLINEAESKMLSTRKGILKSRRELADVNIRLDETKLSKITPEATPVVPNKTESIKAVESKEVLNITNERINNIETGFIDGLDNQVPQVKETRKKAFGSFVEEKKSGAKLPEQIESQHAKAVEPEETLSLSRKFVKTPEDKINLTKIPIERVEKRMQAAKGAPKVSRTQKFLEAKDVLVASFTRTWLHLDPLKYPEAQDILRRMSSIDGAANFYTDNFLSDVGNSLDIHAKNLFENKLIFGDMLKDLDEGLYDWALGQGKALNFDVKDRAELVSILKHVDSALDDPGFAHVKATVKMRNEFMNKLKDEAIDWGVLPEKVRKVNNYWHRQILNKMNYKRSAFGKFKPGLSKVKSGEQLRRKGSIEDFNTEYFEAEHDVIKSEFKKIEYAKLTEELNEAINVRPELVKKAKIEIETEFAEKIEQIKRKYGKGYRFSEEYKEKIIPKIDFLKKKYGEKYKSSKEFKEEITPKIQDLKKKYGKGFKFSKEYDEILSLIEKRIEKLRPANIVDYLPEESPHFRQVFTLEEDIMEQFFKDTRLIEREDFKTAMALGKGSKKWMIPEDMKIVLTKEYGMDPPSTGLDRIAAELNREWKGWTLINPTKLVKYNFNNLSGDTDIAFVGDPVILLGMKRAAGDLLVMGRTFEKFKKSKFIPFFWKNQIKSKTEFNNIKREMLGRIKNGEIESGFIKHDFRDVRNVGFEKFIQGGDPFSIKKIFKLPGMWWQKSKDFTNWRENVTRLAAARRIEKVVKSGKKKYYASNKIQVDAIKDPKLKSAKMSRELIGDYGNTSHAGRYLAKHLIPFYRFIEINAPRYVRLFKNVKHEGPASMAATGAVGSLYIGKKLAFGYGKFALKATALFGLISLFNRARFPEEAKLFSLANRGQLHILLGYNSEGKMVSFRFQGSLNEAFDILNLADFPQDIGDIVKRRVPIKRKLKETLYEGPVNKVVSSLTPFLKTPLELLTGKQLWPDAFSPRPIRDKAEHAARVFSLGGIYRKLRGKPGKNFLDSVLSLVVETNDLGEASYWVAMNRIFDFIKDEGIETPSGSPTKRSNALFYARQFLKNNEPEKAQEYLKEYKRLGGTIDGMRNAYVRLRPEEKLKNAVGKKKYLVSKFISTLDKRDKAIFTRANKWINSVYAPRSLKKDFPQLR